MMTVTRALKKGYVPTKIEIEVLMDPETGNLLYPCDGNHGKHGAAFDRYAIISDPVVDGKNTEDKAVNLVCKDHKKRYMKQGIPPSLEGLLRLKVQMYLGKKWEKVSKKMVSRLYKKQGWFRWLYPENED